MTDDLFAEYVARGIDGREEMIIPRDDRDAALLECEPDGDRFLTPVVTEMGGIATSAGITNWVDLVP